MKMNKKEDGDEKKLKQTMRDRCPLGYWISKPHKDREHQIIINHSSEI